MTDYRAYLIDQNDRIFSVREFRADSDEEALNIAKQFVNGCDVEVWSRSRKVGRLTYTP
jgi:hypothetical protein